MLTVGLVGPGLLGQPRLETNARGGVGRAGAGGSGDPGDVVPDLEMAPMTDEEREELMVMYPLLRWFDTSHLTDPELVKVVNRFRAVAMGVARDCKRGPEVTVCIRKLLEAKDAGVRAYIETQENA